jgi:hypothetical protein
MGDIHVNEQVQYSNSVIPKEVFLSYQTRMKEVVQNTQVLLEDILGGDTSRLETTIAMINPKRRAEFELMAQVIVSKALDEPQHCKACVSLSGAFHVLLPALPSAHRHKTESFMHALLDAFQTEFEKIFTPYQQQTLSGGVEILPDFCESCEESTRQRDVNRINAIVQFAGHLYCHGLLGNGVVTQMVQDLVDNGEGEAANGLLWFIGVTNAPDHGNLGTVLEDSCDSDGADSGSVSCRPSCT